MSIERQALILGIETSCDETSAAVVESGRFVRSNVVSSQIATHRQFGGVVPEVASRQHLEHICDVVDQALLDAGVDHKDLDAIAVTFGPGLVGALLVGVTAAKSLAQAWQLPLVGVHHVAGHIAADQLAAEPLAYPFLALVVSGGHTELIAVHSGLHLERLGGSRDDAVGEAYDKVARALGLPYPGGPEVDRLAGDGDPQAYALPRPWLEDHPWDFSFSGLKSAVQNLLHNAVQRDDSIRPADMAASFQSCVTEVLVGKTLAAADAIGLRRILVAGGVAANRGLRAVFAEAQASHGVDVRFPPLALCGDNAAMIAAAAFPRYQAGIFHDLGLNALANVPLSSWCVV